MDNMSPYLMLVIGLPLLLGGAELLVRYAVKLSSLFGRSRFLIGMTVLAFGTSAPEMAIGVFDVIDHEGSIGLGNILGSNIFNIFFVLGLAAVLRPVSVDRVMFRRDVPILLGISILFYLLGLNGAITVTESLVLVGCFVAYMAYLWRGSRERVEVISADLAHPEEQTISAGRVTWQAAAVVVGIVLLATGAHFLVEGAVGIARRYGVSELTIGLSIVAVGTSLPEIVTTLMAVWRREFSMAVGNILGSCIFNLIAVPTVMVMVSFKPIIVGSDVLLFDLPEAILAVLACLPIFLTGWRISRAEGALFLVFYGLYSVVLYAKERPASTPVSAIVVFAMLAILVALVTLAVVVYRLLRPGMIRAKRGTKQ